jgi:hypothetical protein
MLILACKEWLEDIYDKARLHSSLGYMLPAQLVEMYSVKGFTSPENV